MTIKEIAELRKTGDLERAYSEAKRLITADPDDSQSRVCMAYCIKSLMEQAAKAGDAATLEQLLGELGALRLEDIGEAELNNKAAWDVRALILRWKDEEYFDPSSLRKLFDAVSHVSFARPHRYYSVLLDAFLKIKDRTGNPWSDIAEFIGWWGLENLMPEDYKRVLLTNGQPVPSLAERAYTAMFKSIMASLARGEMEEEAEAFIGDLEVLEETHPEFQYILYQKTQLLKALGHIDAALDTARGFVRRRKNDFWSWALLGDTADDEEAKLACYCRALMCRAEASYLGKVRNKLAVVMYNLGYYANARREFDKIISLYDYKGWRLPPNVESVMHQQWYQTTVPADSNREFYATHAGAAEAFLMGDMPEIPVLITKYNVQKQVCTYATADHKRGFFSTKRLRGQFGDNQIWMVRFDGEPGGDRASNVLTCRRAEDIKPYDGIFYRRIVAPLNMRPGMSFLFVDDIYVDGTFLQGIQPGTEAAITAVLYYNIKKESWGWRAVGVRPM